MFLLIFVTLFTTVLSRQIIIHNNHEITLFEYKRPQSILSWVPQNKYLAMPDNCATIWEGNELTYVYAPSAIERYVWQYTGFFEATWTGHHTFTIEGAEVATIQLGTKLTQSQEFDHLIVDEKQYLSQSPANFDLVKGERYAMNVVSITGKEKPSIFLIKDGAKHGIEDYIRQPYYSKSVSKIDKTSRQFVYYYASGLDYFVFLLPPGLDVKTVLAHYRALIIVDEGTFEGEFRGLKLDYVYANQSLEVFGNIKAPKDGVYTISMRQNVLASLQISPVEFKQRKISHSINENWGVVDTRCLASEKFHFKKGVFYPFRLAVVGDIHQIDWDLSAYDSDDEEVDLFGLWGSPREWASELSEKSKDVSVALVPQEKTLTLTTLVPELRQAYSTEPSSSSSQGSLDIFETGRVSPFDTSNSQSLDVNDYHEFENSSLSDSLLESLYNPKLPDKEDKSHGFDLPSYESRKGRNNSLESFEMECTSELQDCDSTQHTSMRPQEEMGTGQKPGSSPWVYFNSSLEALSPEVSLSNSTLHQTLEKIKPSSGMAHFFPEFTIDSDQEDEPNVLQDFITDFSADHFRVDLGSEDYGQEIEVYSDTDNEATQAVGFQSPRSDEKALFPKQAKAAISHFDTTHRHFSQVFPEKSGLQDTQMKNEVDSFHRPPSNLGNYERDGVSKPSSHPLLREILSKSREDSLSEARNKDLSHKERFGGDDLVPKKLEVTESAQIISPPSEESVQKSSKLRKENEANSVGVKLMASQTSINSEQIFSMNGYETRVALKLPLVLGVLLAFFF